MSRPAPPASRKKRVLLIAAMAAVLAGAALVNLTGSDEPAHPVVQDDLLAAGAPGNPAGAASPDGSTASGSTTPLGDAHAIAPDGPAGMAGTARAAGGTEDPIAALPTLPARLTGRNPFLWPGEDRPAPKPTPRAAAPVVRQKKPAPAKKKVDLSKLPPVPLSLILTQGPIRVAVIGTDVVQVGARWDREVVASIAGDHIVLEGPDWRRTVPLPSPAAAEAAAARAAASAGSVPPTTPAASGSPASSPSPENISGSAPPTGLDPRMQSANKLAEEALKAFTTSKAKAAPQKTENNSKK